MTNPLEQFDDNDLVITFKPDVTPDEEEHFLTEFASIILSIARHVVALEAEQSGQTHEAQIEDIEH